MKRIFCILSIALVAAISCTVTEISELSGYQSQISFYPYVESTRATEADLAALKGYGFTVSAYLESGDLYFDGDEIEYKDGSWVCTTQRYWPASGSSITFDAYAYDSEALGGTITKSESDRTLAYTCSSDIDKQVDLLAVSATIANGQTAELDFGHILSEIKFSVDFTGTTETNVTLGRVNVIYHNIIDEGTYSFVDNEWTLDGSSTLGDGYATTAIESYETKTGDDIIFYPSNALMILPQDIKLASDGNYISISVEYTLNAGDGTSTAVTTGTMELPAPSDALKYEMGTACTYNIVVNGEQVLVDVEIEDAEEPLYSYGNINLGLITDAITYSEYVEAIASYTTSTANSTTGSGKQYYYSTAVRVAELLADGVRDFVVVGSLGATGSNDSFAKLGYYGSTESPFFIASESLGMIPEYEIEWEDDEDNLVFTTTPNSSDLFSIDLRGVYGFPTFADSHDVSAISNTLDDDAPILTSGLFKDLPLLDEVILPHGLLAIGEHTFQNCISLSSIDLAEVIHIEKGAFVDCKGLETVIGGAITRVHDYGFDDCAMLQSIDLSNLVEVNASGFVECSSLGEVNLSSLVIADKSAFADCTSMTLSDPDMTALTTVGDYAFQKCSSLGEVEFEALTTIGAHAFSNCTNMYFQSSPLVLESLESIGSYAFQDCITIGAIQFPKVTEVADGAFHGCINLELTGDLTQLTSIGSYAFQDCAKIGTVDFELIGSIGAGAFHGCTLLKLSDNDDLSLLTSIGNYTFQDCSSLDNTDLNLDKVTTVGKYGFEDCSSLVGVSLDAVVSIDDYAFEGCSALSSNLTMDKLTTIGASAFANCTELSGVSIEAIESIGDSAFYKCSTLSSNLVMDNLTTIGTSAFAYCTGLKGLTLNNVTSVGDNFIYDCTGLETFIMPKVTVDSSDSSDSDITAISDMLFSACTTLITVDVEALEISSFTWNDWDYDRPLKTINIAACKKLENFAFYKCEELVTIDASSVTSVGNYSFQYCTSLEELILPAVVSFGESFISGCTSLKTLSMPALVDGTTNDIFSIVKGCTTLETLILPLVTGSAGGWAKFSSTSLKYVDLSSVTEFVGGSFYYDSELSTPEPKLEAINLSSATSIGDCAFQNCTTLKKINLSTLSSSDNIGSYAFSGIPADQCEIWLSDEQAALAEGSTWQDVTWKAIYKASDNVEFTLIEVQE